jgi:hypothetical protein
VGLVASLATLSCTGPVSLGSFGDTEGAVSSDGGVLPECNAPGEPAPANPPGPSIGATVTYTDWFWPTAFDSIEWDQRIESDVPNDGYLWMHRIPFAAGPLALAGLQANGGYQADPPSGPVEITKMAVFWMARPSIRAELGDVAYPNARTAIALEVGIEWWTINVRYDWQACRTYRFRVGLESIDPSGDVWYGAWIRDTQTGVETFLGRVLVPAAWGKLSSPSSVWSNRIGWAPLANCAMMEPAAVLFGAPTANGGTLSPSSRENRFAAPFGCPSSRFTDFPEAVRHELGVAP